MILFNIIRRALQMERQYSIEEPMVKKYRYDNDYRYDNNYTNELILESDEKKIKRTVSFDLKSESIESLYSEESENSDDFEEKMDLNISNMLKRKYSKIKLEYKSSGSNGVILYNESNPDYIYKDRKSTRLNSSH